MRSTAEGHHAGYGLDELLRDIAVSQGNDISDEFAVGDRKISRHSGLESTRVQTLPA